LSLRLTKHHAIRRRISSLINHHVMKTNWGVEVQLYTVLTSAIDGGQLSASRAGHVTPGVHRYPLDRRLGGPQSLSDAIAKRKKFHHCPCRELNSRRLARSLVTILTEVPWLLVTVS
jgi:hypothetical protein